MAIEVKAEDRGDVPEMETIKLVGEDYEFYFPKVGALLSRLRRAGQESKDDNEKGERYFELQMSWLERGFGEETWEEITDRLEDDDDALEQEHLTQAFSLLLKAGSGRPPTSSTGSSRSRSASKPKAARSRRASTSVTSDSEKSAT